MYGNCGMEGCLENANQQIQWKKDPCSELEMILRILKVMDQDLEVAVASVRI